MNIDSFYYELNLLLRDLPRREREQALSYYSEIIADSMEDGYSQEEAILKLGDLHTLAENILEENQSSLPFLKGRTSGARLLNIILLILGSPLWLSFMCVFFVLVLTVYILIYVPLFVVGIIAAALPLSGLWCIIGSPFLMAEALGQGIFQLGIGITVLGLSIFFFIVFYYVLKWTIKLTKLITKMIVGLFRRKGARSGQ